jgi:hypothetical protein
MQAELKLFTKPRKKREAPTEARLIEYLQYAVDGHSQLSAAHRLKVGPGVIRSVIKWGGVAWHEAAALGRQGKTAEQIVADLPRFKQKAQLVQDLTFTPPYIILRSCIAYLSELDVEGVSEAHEMLKALYHKGDDNE